MYLAEIAPKQHRGKLVSLSPTAAAAGTLVHDYWDILLPITISYNALINTCGKCHSVAFFACVLILHCSYAYTIILCDCFSFTDCCSGECWGWEVVVWLESVAGSAADPSMQYCHRISTHPRVTKVQSIYIRIERRKCPIKYSIGLTDHPLRSPWRECVREHSIWPNNIFLD